jgi:hypothetical protein
VQQETPTKRELVAALSRAREATPRLVERVDEEQLVRQVSPIMSPLVWDLTHIGWFEELDASPTMSRCSNASTTCTTRSATRTDNARGCRS